MTFSGLVMKLLLISITTLLTFSFLGLNSANAKQIVFKSRSPSYVSKSVGCSTSKCHSDLKNDLFVHGPVKADGCKICHRLENGSEVTPNIPSHPLVIKIKPININETCTVCHDSFKQSLSTDKFIHKPLQTESCVTCHNPHHSKFKNLLKSSTASEVCFSCHKEIKSSIEHYGFKHGAISSSNSCVNCHSPHSSNHKSLLKLKEDKLCLSCHDKNIRKTLDFKTLLSQNKVHHKPVQDGNCSSCHHPHGSHENNSLKKYYSNLCFECHKTTLMSLPHASDQTKFRNGRDNLHFRHLQGNKQQRNCNSCHEVHASSQMHLISDWTPFYNGIRLPIKFTKTETGGNCLTACHMKKSYDRAKGIENEPGK